MQNNKNFWEYQILSHPELSRNPKFLNMYRVFTVTGDKYLREILEKYIQLAGNMPENIEMPPFEIPMDPVLSEGIYPIGTLHSGVPYCLSPDIVNRHLLCVGSSGSGKSNLNLVLLSAILSRM